MKSMNKIKLFVPSYLSNLSLVRAMTRVYLREHNVAGADEIQLLSVVDELAPTAIEHAYDYGQGEIKIVLDIYNNTVFLTVEDYGRGYTENTESKEDGGYGLFIARKLVDVLKIEKKTRGTIFKVEKKLKEAV